MGDQPGSGRRPPIGDFREPKRTWQDVAKQIIWEPDSEKLSDLVKELCQMLDEVRKRPTGVPAADLPSAPHQLKEP
jgi:hypothetical protein